MAFLQNVKLLKRAGTIQTLWTKPSSDLLFSKLTYEKLKIKTWKNSENLQEMIIFITGKSIALRG